MRYLDYGILHSTSKLTISTVNKIMFWQNLNLKQAYANALSTPKAKAANILNKTCTGHSYTWD